MVEALSPLGDAWRPGSHANFADGVGVTLTALQPGSIVQVTAWPTGTHMVHDAIYAALAIELSASPDAGIVGESVSAFAIGPLRHLIVAQGEAVDERLRKAIPAEAGVVTDLTHGRSAIRLRGEKAEWVLLKLFPIDFAAAAFPIGAGRASQHHHDIAVLIQRVAPDAFDLYVYRSFARSFWLALCRASEEVGYEVR